MRNLLLSALLGALLVAAPERAAAQAGDECPDDVGAAIAAACPCDADQGGRAWKNHGKYVSCVVRFRNDLRRAGCLDAQAKREIARCAARSTCGKEGAVLCCTYDTSGTCDDAGPGDGTAAGVCSNGAGAACDTDADCISAEGPKVHRRGDTCTARGGTIVGTGSVCGGCPLPPPMP